MDAVAMLREAVSIPSSGNDEKALAAFMEGALRGMGFSVRHQEIAPGRHNLLAERGQGAETGLYGHLDTVAPAPGWEGDPYTLREEGDRLTGLGAWDMKAGLCAIVCAARSSACPLKVAFGVDEENISEGAHAIVESGFFKGCKAIISTDTGGDGGEHLGERQLTLGRLGRAVYEFSVPGRAAHGADPGGVNAIEQGAELVRRLRALKAKRHRLLPKPPIFVRSFRGSTDSLSLPDSAVLELDRHLVPPETSESVLGGLRAFIDTLYAKGIFAPVDGKRITVSLKERKTHYLVPQMTGRTDPAVKRLENIIRGKFGTPKIAYGNSVADENVLALSGIPVITYGPSGDRMHSPGEWVSKRSYLGIIEGLGAFLGPD